MSNTVTLQRDDDIAVIAIHNPPVNTITAPLRADLRAALTELSGWQGVKAVVLCCEGSTFCSGADIGEFDGPPREAEYHALFGALENLPMPVIAALHGTALGGGLELALAAHYRVASPGSRFGLPELSLGIIPGAGGSQRLPRLIGAEATLALLFSMAPLSLDQAQSLGLVDAAIDGDLRQGALDYARKLQALGLGPRRTGQLPVKGADEPLFERFRQQAAQRFAGRQAPLLAIEAVQAAARVPLEQGLVCEEALVNQAKQTRESQALVRLFFAERESRKVVDLAADTQARAVDQVAIIGAGTMGGGIAMCFADAGIPVRLIDAGADGLRRGLANIEKNYAARVARGRMSEENKAGNLRLIRGEPSLDAARDADLIIEAVFEDLALKKDIFGQLDRIAKPGAILATNTSTLDIDAIADATARPRDVIGLHFFSPANVMPLLEVVRTERAAPDVVCTAMELAKRIRKTPVLARVCYGFIGNRMMEGYAREAERMVLEGASPRQVDDALQGFGFAMGILSVFDMAGIDVGTRVHAANADQYPPDPSYYQADFALVAAGRLGQKNGKGYYRYEPGDRTRHDDPEAIAILRRRAQELGVPQQAHGDAEIVERCLLPLINEGFRILEEGIAQRASDVDLVWTAGYGFPRHRGGPLFYADTLGLQTVYDGICKYRDRFGPMHWQPAKLLQALADSGRSLADWEAGRPAGV